MPDAWRRRPRTPSNRDDLRLWQPLHDLVEVGEGRAEFARCRSSDVQLAAVLHIFLWVVEAHLRKSCPGASAQALVGAVSFLHRLGASLNRHLHYHCCILDGVFDPLQAGGVQFRQASALTPKEVAVIAEQVRRPVLHWFSRHRLLDPDDARDMLAWVNGGSSLRELSGEHT